MSDSAETTRTLAVGSADLMARKAEKLAVPPPIRRYGIWVGMSQESRGYFVMWGGRMKILSIPVGFEWF